MIERPTGIIRTLPYNENACELALRQAYRNFLEGMRALEDGGDSVVYIAMAQKPTVEVLHCYLLLGGKIRCRANIAGFTQMDDHVECWDGTIRDSKWWMMLSGPVSYPPEPIPRRGFRGFRYCGDLW